jgi:hypothetical protein
MEYLVEDIILVVDVSLAVIAINMYSIDITLLINHFGLSASQ